jgi:hypothetical protein
MTVGFHKIADLRFQFSVSLCALCLVLLPFGFAAFLAERLCLSVHVLYDFAATPLSQSPNQQSPNGKPEAFRKECGKAGRQQTKQQRTKLTQTFP